LDIKGLSKATLEKLIDWGWVSQPADLYRLVHKQKEWIKKPGFGEKSVENILSAIEVSRFPKLSAFISALGIPLIGTTVSKDLTKYIDSYEDFKNKAKTKWDFTKIDGIAYEKASAIWNFNFDEADAVDEYILGYLIEETDLKKTTLEATNVVITGRLAKFKNRNELIKSIEEHGGKVVSSVSKNTNILINNDINSNSAKNIAAQRLNIPIMTEEEFCNLYLTD
jgi:DNA ligase (NAD+)